MKNIMKSAKGFTLIELLVVIAIIGILAALVLVALGSARDKANDARIKSDISQLRTIAEIVYDNMGSTYESGANGVETCFETPTTAECANDAELSANVTTLINDINDANGATGGVPTAEATSTAFCAEATLNTGNFICADSTGIIEEGHTTARCSAAADVSCAS